MKIRNLFKFFLVWIPREVASISEDVIDDVSDIFSSGQKKNFIGYEKPYIQVFEKKEEKENLETTS